MKFEFENVKQVGFFGLAVVGAFFTTQVHADAPGQVNVNCNSPSNSAAPQEAIDDAVDGTVIRVNGDRFSIGHEFEPDMDLISICRD